MFNLRRLTLCAALCLATVSATGLAHGQERMRPVGSVQFEPEPFAVEKGVFNIKPEDRRIRSLRIEADEGSADVRSFLVIYADGETERVRVRQTLKEGERTAVFELDEPRPVKAVEVSYIPKGAVTLLLLADARRPEPPRDEWKELGCKTVGFLIDRDSIFVDTPDRYKALRIRNSGYDIEMMEMSVRYGAGGRDNFSIRAIIPNGGRTSPIPLRGESRKISQIDMLYRSGVISNRKTKVCVDGLLSVKDEEN